MPTKKKKPNKPNLLRRHPIAWSLLGLLVIVVLGILIDFKIYDYRLAKEIATERQQYAQARADLHEVYQEIIKEIGEPAQHKSVQSCGYTSQDFGRGARFCDLNEYAFYDVSSKEQASELAGKINLALSRSSLVRNIRTSYPEAYEQLGVLSSSFMLPTFDQCGGDYNYVVDVDPRLPGFILPGRPGLSISLYCTGGAKAEYYPVINE